jgi:hypothetical protein
VLLLRLKLGPPQQRSVAKHPQILTGHLRPELVEQIPLKSRGKCSAVTVACRFGRCVSHVQSGPITIRALFSEKTNMSTPQDDNQPVVWTVLVAVIVLAVGLAVGFGIAKSKKAAPAAAPVATAPAVDASAPAADASAPVADASAPAAAASAPK